MTKKTLFPLLIASALCAQEPEGNSSLKPQPPAAGMLKATQFSRPGMTGSSVGITMDDQGRVYVSHTNRRTNAEIDIRKNPTWLEESLALTSPEGRQELIKKKMPDTWKSLAKFKEKIIRLEDKDGDGVADEAKVVFEGLNELGSGLAGGVLWHDGALYVTCMPSLWKLTDKDDDGIFETKEELARGIGYHIGYGGHDMHGPTLGMDGRIYWTTGDKGIHVKTKDGRDFHYPGQGGCFRIEPDGSGFEVFAHGLRNPQELAFDEFGNLFNVDNDGDFGDKERVVHIIEGSDSGWRAQYQYRSDRKWASIYGYNPWLAENLWKPQEPGQPAYLLPPLANFTAGPCGFEYNPGTALSDSWKNTFFIVESSKQISAFKLQPAGATFKMLTPELAFTGAFITGIWFGNDGALYGADWGENEWMPHMKGGVLKLDAADAVASSAREEVNKLIGSKLAGYEGDKLVALLDHADQRIRLKAQFKLVAAKDAAALVGAAKSASTLVGKVHALWGLGQLARKDASQIPALESFLTSPESELRAQAARMISDASSGVREVPALGALLADASPRVRLYAAIALKKLGAAPHFDAVVKLLSDNNDTDRALAHGGALALSSVAKTDAITKLVGHPSVAVRKAAVVACREATSPHAALFLKDADVSVVAEAARAVHDDSSIPEALPDLARLLDNVNVKDDATLRRAISAAGRTGSQEDILRVLSFAQRADASVAMREEALDTISLWIKGIRFDRVQGYYRGLAAHQPSTIADAFGKAFDALITDKSDVVQRATARVVRALNYQPAIEKLTSMALDTAQLVDMRATALETLAVARAPRVQEAVTLAIKSTEPKLRIAALRAMAEIKPDDAATFAALDAALKRDALSEQQAVFSILGTLRNGKAETVLKSWVDKLAKNKVLPTLALDVYEAAIAHGSKTLKKQVSTVDKSLKGKAFGAWSLSLAGGDAAEGELIFKTSTTGACVQCHNMAPGVPGVGPDLHGVATRRKPDQLLRAVVDPQGEIADGYGMIVATLKNGSVQSGLLVKETKDELTLRLPATPITNVVKKADIASRTKPASAMPVMTSLLTRMEVRDIVAYLQTLK